ncbi:MAG: ABC transporter permease [Gemmatimonadota bacterium]
MAAVVLLVLLCWLVAYPLLLVALEAVHGAEGFTLAYVRQFVSRPIEWDALWGSCWISLASMALAALVGVPLAVLLWRFDFPGRKIVATLLALPAVLPPLVGVISFVFLYGEAGFIARLVQWLTGQTDPPWQFEGAGAILLVHTYSMYVYFYLFTRAGLERFDAAQLEAAASLGASRWRTLRDVALPALRPSLVGAALLTFMTSLASFSAPYIFGGGFRVMTTRILATRLNGEDGLAQVQTVFLTLLALGGLWGLRRLEGRDRGSARRGAPTPLRPVRAGAARAAAGILAWTLGLVLLLPHLTLLLVSFVPRGTWTTEPLPPVYALINYATLFRDPVRLGPLLNSLWMATVAAAVAVGVALLAGALSTARRAPATRLIDVLLALPWAVPGTVFAIALATLLSVDRPLTGRFLLVGTIWILPLAYLIRNLPLASRAILAGFRRLDPSLREAAASLAAGPWRTLRRVTLPLLRPSIAAAATLAFVTGFGDFVTSVLLYTYDSRPVSLEILSSLRQADVGVAAAYGVLLMAVSAVVFALGGEAGSATA